MKQLLLVFALLFITAASFAQQAATATDPCKEPVVELYDANRQKLAEDALPTGKVTMLVRNNPGCNKDFTFKAGKMKLYLMDGEKTLTQVEFNGNSFDFSGWQKYYASADNIRIEITEVRFTYNKGEETGNFPGSVHKNWHLKTN